MSKSIAHLNNQLSQKVEMKGIRKKRQLKSLKYKDFLKGIIKLGPRIPSIVKSTIEISQLKDETRLSLGGYLEKNAVSYKDKPAILFEKTILTHYQFNCKVNQYAHFFLSKGFKKGNTVSLLIENRPEQLITIGALNKIGVVASLINSNLRSTALIHCLNLTPDRIYIVGEELIDAFENVREDLEYTQYSQFYYLKDKGQYPVKDFYHDITTGVKNQPVENPSATKNNRLSDVFCYVFTSGTTGLPKAAPQTNYQWVSALYWFGKVTVNLNSNDIIYVTLPFYHSNALNVAWPIAAAGGAAIAIRRKFSARYFWKDVEMYQATAFSYIGELCRYLIKQPLKKDDTKNTIQKIVGNGLKPELWLIMKHRFCIPFVYEFYGATEMSIVFTNLLNLDGTMGFSSGNYAIAQCDIETGELLRNEKGFLVPVKKGEAGVLLFETKGRKGFNGYTDESATRKKIIEGGFKKGDCWCNTDDLIREIGFGHVQFVDRMGDTFRMKGENVSTAEVEKMINQFDQICESTVYGVSLPGIDGRAGMACITLNVPVDDFDSEEFLFTIKQHLPSYAMPLFLRFRDKLETTSTFKVIKSKLRTEGFDIKQINDPILFMNPELNRYVELEIESYEKILSCQYRF